MGIPTPSTNSLPLSSMIIFTATPSLWRISIFSSVAGQVPVSYTHLKNVTGNQNRFSSCIAKLPNKGAYLRNTDGIEAVDWLIQNQKFWIVHNGKGNRKPLLHTKGILGKELFIFVGQSYQIQSVFYGMIVWYAPQSSKDTQVLCAGQIGIKAGGLDQTANTGQ